MIKTAGYLLGSILAACFLVGNALAHSYDKEFYRIYEKDLGGGQTHFFIVPAKVMVPIAVDDIFVSLPVLKDGAFSFIKNSDGSISDFVVLDKNIYNHATLSSNDDYQLTSMSIAYGDLNRDGESDIFIYSTNEQDSSILLTNGSGGPALLKDFGPDFSRGTISSVRIADYDVDNDDDIVVTQNDGFSYAWLQADNGFEKSSNALINNLAVGSIKGYLDVDAQGAATYTIPITIATGTAGWQPVLSLQYSSAAGTDIAGAGWSLTGMSSIARCKQEYHRDGLSKAIKFNNEDRFCLDGMRLVAVAGSYGSVGAEYRLEISDHSIIRSYGGVLGSPDYFTVQRKDGSLAYYGNGNGSRQLIGGNVFKWSISRHEDAAGNPIKYSYLDSDAYGLSGHRISRIDYAYGDLKSGSGNSNTYISFDYEGRQDYVSGYVLGAAYSSNQRLSAINIYSSHNASTALIKKYYLEYDGEIPEVSILKRVYECSEESCISPLTFSSQKPLANFVLQGGVTAAAASRIAPRVVDLNLDGRDDVLFSVPTNTTGGFSITQGLSNGGSFNVTAAPVVLKAYAPEIWHVLDYNLDSYPDLLMPGDVSWVVYKGSVSGITAQTIDTGIPITDYTKSIFMDYNADGLADMVTINSDINIRVRYGRLQTIGSVQQFSFASTESIVSKNYNVPMIKYPGGYTGGGTQSMKIQGTADFDQDGLDDFIVGEKGGATCYVPLVFYRNNLDQLQAGIAFEQYVQGQQYAAKAITVSDFNQDGLPDVALNYGSCGGAWGEFEPGSEYLWLRTNNGNGFNSAIQTNIKINNPNSLYSGNTNPQSYVFFDYNHDGYEDIVALVVDPATNSSRYKVSINNRGVFNPALIDAVGLPTGASSLANNKTSMLKLDINGDGKLDLALVSDGVNGQGASLNVYASSPATTSHYLITQIDNGMGDLSSIRYGRMYAPAYLPNSDAASAGWDLPTGTENLGKTALVADIYAGTFVVTGIFEAAPKAGISPGAVNPSNQNFTDYRYEGAKFQAGIGLLGFKKITAIKSWANLKEITTYRQDYPFTGLTAKIERRRNSDDRLLSEAETAYGFYSGITSRPYNIYLKQSVEKSYALNSGALLTRSVKDIAVNEYGNVLSQSTRMYEANEALPVKTLTEAYAYGSDFYSRYRGLAVLIQSTHENPRDALPVRNATTSLAYYPQGTPAQGLVQAQTLEPGDSALMLATSFEYDQFGNKKTESRQGAAGLPRVIRWRYDSDGRYRNQTIQNFKGVDYVMEDVVERNASGLPLRIEDVNGLVATFAYDDFFRETFRGDNAGKTLVKSYTNQNISSVSGARYKVVTDEAGGRHREEYYDAKNRLIATATRGFDGLNDWIYSEYDSVGRMVHKTVPSNTVANILAWEKFTYDELGRVISAVDANGIYTTYIYEGLNKTRVNFRGIRFRETYNALGQLLTSHDAGVASVSHKYDVMGNLLSSCAADLVTGTSSCTEMSYDKLGRKVKLVDPNKGTHFYKYNAFGEIICSYKVMGQNRYDGDLDAALAANVAMQRIEIERDEHGRPAIEKHFKNNAQQEQAWRYLYDGENAIGKPVGHTNWNNYAENYYYDQYGRPQYTEYLVDNDIYWSEQKYDGFGRLHRHVDVSGHAVEYRYNNYGYPYQIVSVLKSGASESHQLLYTIESQNSRDQVLTARAGNGYIATQQFDILGRVTRQLARDSLGAITLQDMRYSWDGAGNVTSRTNNNLYWNVSSYVSRNLQQSFCYDVLDRLIKTANAATIDCSSGFDTFYSGLGNITSTVSKGAYTYFTDGTKPNAVKTAAGITYMYDTFGNMTSDSSGRSVQYTVNDLASSIRYGTLQTDFAYNAAGKRWKKTETSNGQVIGTVYYLGTVEKWLKPNGRYEWRRDLGGVAQFTHHMNSSNAQTSLVKRYTYKDALGSLLMLTDHLGNLQPGGLDQNYTPWGERALPGNWGDTVTANYLGNNWSQVLPSNKGFTGHEMLDGVGLIHMNGRIYDQRLQRFIQADPYIQNPGYSQSYNRYSYVMNNPLNATDPSGFYCEGNAPCGWSGGYGGIIYFVPDGIASAGGGVSARFPGWSTPVFNIPGLNFGEYDSGRGVLVDPNGREIKISATNAQYVLRQQEAYKVFGGKLHNQLGSPPINGVVKQRASQAGLPKSYGYTVEIAQKSRVITINSTSKAVSHYLNGKGASVELDENTKKALTTSEEHQFRLDRIKTGQTESMSGNYSVDLTGEIYHVGLTRVDYSTSCQAGLCSTTFTGFSGDGFWDPIAPKGFGDGLGGNWELPGGRGYRYNPYIWTETYRSPY